jgi:DNA-binding Lrp family transcriptional regulator
MTKALILINTAPGADRGVANKVKKLKGVQNVYLVSGLYDVVAEVQADDASGMVAFVYDKLRVIKGISGTHTMFCLDV